MKKRNILFLMCAAFLCGCACSHSDPEPPQPPEPPEPVVTKYSVDYTLDPHVNWSGPSSINEKTELRAAAIVHTGFVLDKSKVTVTVAGNPLNPELYTYSSSVLIIPANCITGNVVITSAAYVDTRVAVDVQVAHTTNTFPSRIEKGTRLTGTLIPNGTYFLPETIDVKSGDDSLDVDEDYTYDSDTGDVAVFENKVTDKITISGEAVQEMSVTFQVGDGTWDGDSDIEDRTVYIKEGYTLFKVIQEGEIPTPKSNDDNLSFNGWYIGDTIVNFNDVLEDGAILVAKYGEGAVNIMYDINHIDLISAPQTIVSGSELEVTLSASEGYVLPDEKHISVLKDDAEVDFTYTTEDYHSASITVNSTDTTDAFIIAIAIDGYDSYEITFDPNGGQWQDQSESTITISNIPITSTYKEVIDQLYDENGIPSKEEKLCANWLDNNETINKYQTIDGSAFKTLKAIYLEGTSFYSDSWENVVSCANQGIDKLKEKYPEFADNFIGAEKPIEIDENVTAIARVIGVNHDVSTDGSAITLTMEIDHVITIDQYCASGATSMNRWADSQLRTKLNNEFLTKLTTFNEGLEPKETQRNTISGKGSETTGMTIDRLFPLSGTEIGLPAVSATGEYAYDQREGSIYEFYDTCGSAKQRIKYSLNGGEPTSYWLRSPVKADSKNTFQVLADGDYSTKDVTTSGSTNGYMVAFAI